MYIRRLSLKVLYIVYQVKTGSYRVSATDTVVYTK